MIGPPATPLDYSSSVDRGRSYLFGTQRTTKTGKRRTGFFILCRKFGVETVLILGVFALQLLPDLTKLLDLVRQPEGPVREVSAGVGVTDMNVHSSLPVTLQPNKFLGFSRAFSPLPFLLPWIFSPFLSLVRHPPRSSDTERETFSRHHEPQCRSCIVQNQDERSQGAPFSCWNLGSPHPYPQLYCVRPNSGKVDPGQTVEVQGAIYLLVFNAVG